MTIVSMQNVLFPSEGLQERSQNLAYVLTDQEQLQATLFQEGSYIAETCLPEFNLPGTVQVEMLGHAKEFRLKQNRRGTLMGRLVYLVKVEQVGSRNKLSPLQQCNRLFSVHHTRNINKGPHEHCRSKKTLFLSPGLEWLRGQPSFK